MPSRDYKDLEKTALAAVRVFSPSLVYKNRKYYLAFPVDYGCAAYVNGQLDDESDDLIDDVQLYHYLVDLAVRLDILQKSGSWFSMGEMRLGQGRDAVKQYLKDNPELAGKIESEIRANSYKLMSKQAQIAARAAGRAVDVSADDFDDGSEEE